MSYKMDGLASRTPADIERRYNFGRSFTEIRGIADEARNLAYEAEKIAKEVEAKILNIDVVEALNLSSGTIDIKTEGLTIKSTDFSLSAEDGIKASKGNIGGWDISKRAIAKSTDGYRFEIAIPEKIDDYVIAALNYNLPDGSGITFEPYVPFYVNAKGQLYCEDATISGSITAKEGNIGGWEVLNEPNAKALQYFCYNDDYSKNIGTGFQPPNSGVWAMSVGYTDPNDWGTGQFKVSHDGKVYCQSLQLDQTFSYSGRGTSISGNSLHSLLSQICSALSILDNKVFMQSGL